MDRLFSQPQQAKREQWLQSSKREDEREGMTEMKGYNDNNLNQKLIRHNLPLFLQEKIPKDTPYFTPDAGTSKCFSHNSH